MTKAWDDRNYRYYTQAESMLNTIKCPNCDGNIRGWDGKQQPHSCPSKEDECTKTG